MSSITHNLLFRLPGRATLGWLLDRLVLSLLVTVGFTAPSLAQEPVFSNNGMLWEGQAAGDAAAAANELDQDRNLLALDAALNLDEHSQLIMAEPDADEVARRMAPPDDADRQPQQTGFTRELQGFAQLAPSPAGTQRGNDGRDYVVSQHLVGSAGAVSIRLHFSGVHLPAGARLYVYGMADDGTQHKGYDSAWLGDRTSFWSHTVPGDSAVVEYHAPLDNGTTGRAASYTVDQVVHNVDIFSDDGATSANAADCHLNMCDNPAWRTVGNGIVRLRYIKNGSSSFCSGVLLNNKDNNGIPYIYTANHCISTQGVASTVEIEYFYQRNQCSDDPTDNTVMRLGSMLRATGGGDDDHTLLQADTAPPNGVAFLGWNTASIALGTAVTGIHHPLADFKRISFGNKTGSFSNVHTVTWSDGIIEFGSSGSPLIINGPGVNNVQVIGSLWQLTRGHSCSNPQLPVFYSKFSRAWPSFQPFLQSGPMPDLTVDNVNVTDTSVETGASFTINATARNTGDEASAATTLRYYRSNNTIISTFDNELATAAVGGLAPDASSQKSVTVSIPDAGTWWIGACVDTVASEDTNNNCSTGVQVTVTAPPVVTPTLPDLTVDGVSVSNASVQTGASFTINATARNSGDGASAATTLRYYRSTNNTITTNDTPIGTDAVGGLSAGGSSRESTTVSIAIARTWWVGACVSTVNGETNTNNNCSTGVQVTVTAPTPTLPDLTVGGVSVSDASVEVDVSFTINATARNSGNGASAATTLRYYRSTNNTITTNDTQLATDPVRALAANGSSPESASVSIPDAGTWWVGACVGTVNGETNTNNNCSTGVQVSVTTPPVVVPTLPDLTVGGVSVSDASVEVDVSFTINATARNSGNGASAATTLRYYRSADNTITTNDTQLATDPVSALAANGSSPESASVSIPDAGTWWVGACVGTVNGETNTNNNCSTGVQVSVTTPPVVVPTLPDLTVDGVSVSDTSVQTGVSFTINATARNSGNGASAATTLRYYRSTDNTITTDDSELTTDTVDGLASGATSQENAAVSIADAGNYWIGACVDTVADESETGNNCSTGVQISITAAPLPDLTVDNVSVSDASVEVDVSFTINATARNQGDQTSVETTLRYYRSTDNTITTDDSELTTDTVGGLAPGGFSSESATVSIADAGEYWIGACIGTVNDEVATDNNCSTGVPISVTVPPDNGGGALPAIIQLLLLP